MARMMAEWGDLQRSRRGTADGHLEGGNGASGNGQFYGNRVCACFRPVFKSAAHRDGLSGAQRLPEFGLVDALQNRRPSLGGFQHDHCKADLGKGGQDRGAGKMSLKSAQRAGQAKRLGDDSGGAPSPWTDGGPCNFMVKRYSRGERRLPSSPQCFGGQTFRGIYPEFKTAFGQAAILKVDSAMEQDERSQAFGRPDGDGKPVSGLGGVVKNEVIGPHQVTDSGRNTALPQAFHRGKRLGEELQMGGWILAAGKVGENTVLADQSVGPAAPAIHRQQLLDKAYRPPVG